MKEEKVLKGFAIVVLDRGFVYVGDVEIDDDYVVIKNAHNVRLWGTENGLGQLALEGPTEKTKLDKAGIVRSSKTAFIHLLETDASLWKF